MKIRFILYTMLVTMFVGQQLYAHVFDFSNHTNYPLKVKIHLIEDPSWKTYEATLEPRTAGAAKSQYYFKFGADQGYQAFVEAEWWKGLYGLGEIYVATPIMKKKAVYDENGLELASVEEVVKEMNKETKQEEVLFGPWTQVAVTLVRSEGANAIANAAAALGDGLQGLAKDIAGAVIDYKTNK